MSIEHNGRLIPQLDIDLKWRGRRRAAREWLVPGLCAALAGCGSLADGDEQAVSSVISSGERPEGLPARLRWETVVNNATLIPNAGTKTFSSYNQPSVNASGFVVFRARSTGSEAGGGGEDVAAVAAAAAAGSGPVRGIFTRDMAQRLTPGPVSTVAVNGSTVPSPNNLGATFNEFPSIPRIDRLSRTIATRGQSTPAWEYVTGPDLTTRVGTSGIYATPGGTLQTGANLLGAVRDFPTGNLAFAHLQVPGAAAGTRFDQFPGAPAVAGPSTVAFKGNWTDLTNPAAPVGRTGVYFRNLADPTNPVQRVADSQTLIPGTSVPFGSTAPPSAEGQYMVFVGLDNEESPTRGGVYRARMSRSPTLQTLAAIGGFVPDYRGRATSSRFTRFGEGLSFDGRYVAFWGAWGTQTRAIALHCPMDGNAAVLAYCVEHSADGMGNYSESVPVNQGFFVHDTVSGKTRLAVRSGADFQDMLFWNFSGRPPGTGGGDGEDSLEPPRWRSNAFAALNGVSDSLYRLAFKALRPDASTGLFMIAGPETRAGEYLVIADTRTAASVLDATAPPADAAGTPLTVTSLGLERDAFRGIRQEDGWSFLAINASMANADGTVTWAGIYLTRIRNDD
jgi:hypothetical protein